MLKFKSTTLTLFRDLIIKLFLLLVWILLVMEQMLIYLFILKNFSLWFKTFIDAFRVDDESWHALKAVVKFKGDETDDRGQFAYLCKHGNEDSLGFITEDIVKGRI